MDTRSDLRTVGFGLLAAASAFGGLYAALFGSALLVSGRSFEAFSGAASLVFVVSIAPALAVYFVIRLVARLFGRDERALAAAVGTSFGGAIALAGSFVVSGLFLFVGWFLFPWTFAYAAMVLSVLLRQNSIRASGVALHVGVATAVYVPWIVLTLYNAYDASAEIAGAREGAGWFENFPSAVVLAILYAGVSIAALGAMRSRDVVSSSGQSAPADRSPIR